MLSRSFNSCEFLVEGDPGCGCALHSVLSLHAVTEFQFMLKEIQAVKEDFILYHRFMLSR